VRFCRPDGRAGECGAVLLVIVGLMRWADRHLVLENDDVVAVQLIHRSCGKPADPSLACSHCHEPLTARDITPSPTRVGAE